MRVLVCGVLLAAALAGGGCASADDSAGEEKPVTSATTNGETTLKVGEKSGGMTFTAVTADSRCPRSVQCVWAGDATVVITGADGPHELHVNAEPKSATIDGTRVELVRLDPYPEQPGKIDSGLYQAIIKLG
jgi:hypothetical protein